LTEFLNLTKEEKSTLSGDKPFHTSRHALRKMKTLLCTNNDACKSCMGALW